MAKNGSKISAKKALPGGAKSGASFTKRSGSEQKTKATRSMSGDENYGPRQSSNIGGSVSDDKSGTRSRASLPPQTTAMKSPEATLPKEALDMSSPTLPVPGAHDKLFTVEPWDVARDRKLGKQGS